MRDGEPRGPGGYGRGPGGGGGGEPPEDRDSKKSGDGAEDKEVGKYKVCQFFLHKFSVDQIAYNEKQSTTKDQKEQSDMIAEM